jgi:hypothetical protein
MMIYRILADVLVALHLAFVLFVALGGILVLRRGSWAWIHFPVAAWGALVEFMGWICPLTPLEVRLRTTGGEAGYEGGFVENYVIPLLYPGEITRAHQVVLGLLVVALNAAFYGLAVRRWIRSKR